jgi:two-component system, NarL family, sensor histidine kinase DegS
VGVLMKKDLNKTIEELFNNTIDVVNSGKEEINRMIIDFKDEYGKTLMELSDIQAKLLVTIEEVDSLSIEEKRSRTKLAEVSTDFNRFNESDIKIS